MGSARLILITCLSVATLPAQTLPSKRMPGGKIWTIQNLNVPLPDSYCYEDAEAHCRQYGRLYTWTAAIKACAGLGKQWRLPTNEDWQTLAERHGGLRENSPDQGKSAYQALQQGGASGFNAQSAGNREASGQYARRDAHGFYWTASETGSGTAWFYNFGRGGQSLNRHRDGDKRLAISVRCIRD